MKSEEKSTEKPYQHSLEKQLLRLAESVSDRIYNQRKHLLGRVLTVVEATTSDPEQRKATKDLLNEIFYSGSYWNEIRWEFQQLAKAHGLEILDPGELVPPTLHNPYSEL